MNVMELKQDKGRKISIVNLDTHADDDVLQMEPMSQPRPR